MQNRSSRETLAKFKLRLLMEAIFELCAISLITFNSQENYKANHTGTSTSAGLLTLATLAIAFVVLPCGIQEPNAKMGPVLKCQSQCGIDTSPTRRKKP